MCLEGEFYGGLNGHVNDLSSEVANLMTNVHPSGLSSNGVLDSTFDSTGSVWAD